MDFKKSYRRQSHIESMGNRRRPLLGDRSVLSKTIASYPQLKSAELAHVVFPDLDLEMVYHIQSKAYRGEGADEDKEETIGMIFRQSV